MTLYVVDFKMCIYNFLARSCKKTTVNLTAVLSLLISHSYACLYCNLVLHIYGATHV